MHSLSACFIVLHHSCQQFSPHSQNFTDSGANGLSFAIFEFFDLSNAPEMRATIDCVRGVQFTSISEFRPGLLLHSPAVPLATSDFKPIQGSVLLRVNVYHGVALPLRFFAVLVSLFAPCFAPHETSRTLRKIHDVI